MGVWGPGNFANDVALDIAGSATEVATRNIEAFCASERVTVEDIDLVMGCVAIHLALYSASGAACPDSAVARVLHEQVLRLYDEQIDDLKPQLEYRTERRAVLAETLAAYEKAAADAAA
jgi:hypothetical protein